MTQEIQEGLNRLFELLVPFSKEFNKKTYADIFKDKYEEFRPLFSAIAHECETAENPDEALEEIARVMPDKMHAILKGRHQKKAGECTDEVQSGHGGICHPYVPLWQNRQL